ncbi:MAG: transposase [Cyanobacteriota bacterium]|nr:transposase [Cyanobacteriota bacterium]
MKQVLTVVCKFQLTLEQASNLEATLQAFADACNYANQEVDPKTTNKTAIQSQTYHEIRSRFGLSANLAVRACARVGANRKTAKAKKRKVEEFKPTSIDYDARIFSFREKDWTVSLTLVNGRERFRLELGNYQIGKLKGQNPTSAQLCKHKDGCYYIHIQVKSEPPKQRQTAGFLGVDLGRTDIAVTSDGQKWSGTQVKNTRDKFARVRASIQRKGTRGARRLLKRLSGKERRFQQWANHTISKRIVQTAATLNATIVIEDLTGIRERTNQQPRSKTERRRSNSWAFYQQRQFLTYKAMATGVPLIVVNPAYTSQTCNCCLHIGERKGKRFKCGNCGWIGDADRNGSIMIAISGGAVSRPERLNCKLPSVAEV